MKEQTKFKFGAWLIFAVALAAVLCLGFVAGCNEEVCKPSGWFLGGSGLGSEQETYTARVGIVNADGVEFGAESSWIGQRAQEQYYGAYAIQELQVVELGRQYIGAHASIGLDDDTDGRFYGFVTGVVVPISPNIDAVTEYQFNEYTETLRDLEGTDDAHKISAGLRIKF